MVVIDKFHCIPEDWGGGGYNSQKEGVDLELHFLLCSYVGPAFSPKRFIVTQAPIPSTFGDFWRLVWEQRVGVVVVLTRGQEADDWWPEEGDEHSYSLVVQGRRADSKYRTLWASTQLSRLLIHL